MKYHIHCGSILTIIFIILSSACKSQAIGAAYGKDRGDLSNIRDTITIAVHEGWNLLSVPVLVDDVRISSWFPTATSKAYLFNRAYQKIDSLLYGSAFWLRFASPDTFTISGLRLYEQGLVLHPGWNMVAGSRNPTSPSGLIVSPSSVLSSAFYGYDRDSGYISVDTLRPGKGYWVSAKGNGYLTNSEWELVGLEGERVTAVAIHPNNPDIIYAGSQFDFSAGHQGKLFKSTDGGLSWDTLISVGDYKQIEMDPQHPETLYAVSGTILKSTNGGTTWAASDSGILLDSDTFVWSVLVHPTNSNLAYAGTGGFFGGRLYKTTNGGLSWQDATTNPTLQDGVEVMRFDPSDPNIIFAGTAWSGTLLKTTNAGNSWFITGLPANGSIIKDILVHPTHTNQIYVATYDTAFFSSTDGGGTWMHFDQGLPHTFPSFPQSPDTIVIGTRIILDSNEDFLFSSVSQGQTRPPYGAGPDQGIYICSLVDSKWRKIGIAREGYYYYCDMKLAPSRGMVYFGGQGLHRLRYK